VALQRTESGVRRGLPPTTGASNPPLPPLVVVLSAALPLTAPALAAPHAAATTGVGAAAAAAGAEARKESTSADSGGAAAMVNPDGLSETGRSNSDWNGTLDWMVFQKNGVWYYGMELKGAVGRDEACINR